ncbi:Ribonuclease/ribotoxin, partial [Exidia glandulosa HHB12029]
MVQILYEPSGCNCDGTEYTRADIAAAAKKALELASEGKTLGRDKYPHAYHDYEHFSFSHAQAPYLEFPVLHGEVYTGEAPGADRIVLGSIAEDFQSAVYCAVITHDGQKKNNFAEC